MMEEENEIKIDYEESNQKDPLSQTCDLSDPNSEACIRARKQMEENLEIRDIERLVVTISKSHDNVNAKMIASQHQGKEQRIKDGTGIVIKIAFKESNKTDPISQQLCNLAEPDSGLCARTKMEDSMETRDIERQVMAVSETHENVNADQEQGKEDSHQDAATWYKAIDRFGKYICNFCDRMYTVITSLRYHVKTKHPKELLPLKKKILNNRRQSQPQCHLCKRRFKNLSELTIHIKNHKIENVANSCRFCNAAFNNTQELTQHLKTHNKSHKKLHICDTCGYRTHKLSHFKQHNDTHLKEKRLKCSHCDYATNHPSNLKNHVRIHKKDKPFLCDFEGCGHSFRDFTSLNFHTQKHYPEKHMLHCDKCSYATVYRPSLKVHIESHMRR